MKIVGYQYPDEGHVLASLQPHLWDKLNPRRKPEWITGRKVTADQPVPIITRESGGVYCRFLTVAGLPGLNEMPRLNTDIDVHNQKRGILPIASFVYDHLGRKPSAPYRTVRPGNGRDVFYIAGTYDLKPGSIEPDCFYPKLVRSSGGLGHVSLWEPLFIDPHQAQQWLNPWHNPDFDLKGRAFGFFQFGKTEQFA